MPQKLRCKLALLQPPAPGNVHQRMHLSIYGDGTSEFEMTRQQNYCQQCHG